MMADTLADIWTDRRVKIGYETAEELAKRYNEANWRGHPENQVEALDESLDTLQWIGGVKVNIQSGKIFDGHLRVERALLKNPVMPIPVDYYDLSPDEEALALQIHDAITEQAQPIADKLAALMERTKHLTADKPGLAAMLEQLKVRAGMNGHQPTRDVEPQIDKAGELQRIWGTQLGQVWELGQHRLACGDCTDRAIVEAAMMGEKVVLCHADPPYGMGKENEGIANDNLYREKLDTFQMQWWGVGRPYLEDNASVYIWGNADDLWRLWYCGGLRNSERLTFRNEIVWDKGFAQQFEKMTEGNSVLRSYNPITERCLFFMLGEQGFNNNADNYWEGWEPIRKYLYDEREKMGWDVPTMKRIVGHSDLLRDHWTSTSQWLFPTRDVYEALQAAANGQAFKLDYDALKRDYDALKRDYDALKRDFYATRAYFDNTHENMTDIWQFPRVQGDDRWGHATPKPIEMIKRIVNSSSSEGAIVYSPFLGSGTDLIACENLNRRCRAIELDPGYCAVSTQRWVDLTGQQPRLISG